MFLNAISASALHLCRPFSTKQPGSSLHNVNQIMPLPSWALKMASHLKVKAKIWKCLSIPTWFGPLFLLKHHPLLFLVPNAHVPSAVFSFQLFFQHDCWPFTASCLFLEAFYQIFAWPTSPQVLVQLSLSESYLDHHISNDNPYFSLNQYFSFLSCTLIFFHSLYHLLTSNIYLLYIYIYFLFICCTEN